MKVLTVPQIRVAEENAVLNGIFSYSQMMKNAGLAAAKAIANKYSVVGKTAAVVCGVGNNGGDGFVIANELSRRGCFVTVVIPLGEPRTVTAKEYFNFLPSVNVTDELSGEYDFIIDALFGIGLDRTVSGKAAEVIDRMNMSEGVKIAIDVPSGITSDGKVAGKAFWADVTITFIAMKSCLLVPPASDYCGEVIVENIDVPLKDYECLTIEPPIFKKRLKNSHKGTYGTALLIAGSFGMCGAEILCARAAQKSGVGVVKAAVVDKNYTAFTSSVPEAVTVPLKSDAEGGLALDVEQINTLYNGVDAVLVGSGMGQSFSAKQTVFNVLKTAELPIVLDADGINAICFDINILRRTKSPVIITPHPAEMARLTGATVRDIQSKRIEYARNFSRENGVITVLKGANTLVASPDGRIFINTTGNAGMATAGSGDVLSGIIVSLMAQGLEPLSAAKAGVYLHGVGGDRAAAKLGMAAVTANDIIAEISLD
ncbi:MAG: NAD(P)H-hydrate dehydratase [Clostridia bacterium]|nr:NAD(P)H-hydrate dehydratase [Clostridia bacterium]